MTDHLILIGAIIAATGAMLVIHALGRAVFTSRRRSQVRRLEAGTEPRTRTEAQPRTQRARGGDS